MARGIFWAFSRIRRNIVDHISLLDALIYMIVFLMNVSFRGGRQCESRGVEANVCQEVIWGLQVSQEFDSCLEILLIGVPFKLSLAAVLSFRPSIRLL